MEQKLSTILAFSEWLWQKYQDVKLAQMDFNESLIHTLPYRLEKPNLKHLGQLSDILNKACGILLELHY